MVDVNWHQSAIDNKEYRKVAIQIYAQADSIESISAIPSTSGFDIIKKAIKEYAFRTA